MENYDLTKNCAEINYSGNTMPEWQMTSTGTTSSNYTQSLSIKLDIDELYTMKLAQKAEQPNENSTEYIRTHGILYNRYYVSD